MLHLEIIACVLYIQIYKKHLYIKKVVHILYIYVCMCMYTYTHTLTLLQQSKKASKNAYSKQRKTILYNRQIWQTRPNLFAGNIGTYYCKEVWHVRVSLPTLLVGFQIMSPGYSLSVSFSLFFAFIFFPFGLILLPQYHRQMMCDRAMWKDIWPPVVLHHLPAIMNQKNKFSQCLQQRRQDYSSWPGLAQMPTHVSKGQTGTWLTSVPKGDQGIMIDHPIKHKCSKGVVLQRF